MDGTARCEREEHPGDRALIVEDDETYNGIITIQLEQLGYRVTSTFRGGDFLAKLVENPRCYDIAVVDLSLPDFSGQTVISWLDQSECIEVSKLPILVVTSFPKGVEVIPDETERPLRVLAKPYWFDQLTERISDLTGNRPNCWLP